MRSRNIKGAHDIINGSPYVIQDYPNYRGKWQKAFPKKQPLYMEIGCGKGDFIIENAKRYPHINFIGIEKQASVLVSTVKKLEGIDLPNLRILCMDANHIDTFFANEVDLLYLNFSDPWPKKKHANRRLTSPIFLEKYDKIFRNNHIIEMKTDNQILFEYSLVTLSNYGYTLETVSLDLYADIPVDNIATEYEKKFVSRDKNIYKVRAVLKKVSSKEKK